MKNIFAILLFFLCATTTIADDTTPIQKVFQEYRNALLEGDGKAAWEHTDSTTKSYYNNLVINAFTSNRMEFDTYDFLTKYSILRIRTTYSKSELEKMDGKAFFVDAIEKQWISTATVEAFDSLTQISINNSTASAFIEEDPNTPAFDFVFENDQWRINLTKIIDRGNYVITQQIEFGGATEKELMELYLKASSPEDINPQIYNGPLE